MTKKKSLIDPNYQKISVARQCELIGLNRASYYYEPVPVSQREILLMNKIDEIYTEFPYYGSPKITDAINKQGLVVNHKAIERLMREMGIMAIFPKKNTSKANPLNIKFPYLLKGLPILRPNHVWSTDITYVRAHGIWFYLVAILDWYSRYVLAWRLSPRMTVDFCVDALEEALTVSKPEIHNSDQGSQFTSDDYTKILSTNEIKISMDGRGRCFDNIFVERLWRSVKYEEVYLHDYQSYDEANESLARYFEIYNRRRSHQSLGYRTPAEVYFQK